jgi:hypothetical protein
MSIPNPPVYQAQASAAAMLALWGVLALAAAVYAVVLAVRRRDVLPVAVCIGALVCALNEPIYDTLGKLVYSHVPSGYVAYTAFGRHIPWTLVVGYVPWVGLVSYLLAQRIREGVSRRQLYLVAAGLSVSVGIVEVLNALWMHNWRYYGGHAARGVLGGGIVQMSAMPIVCGFLLVVFAMPARGAARAALGVVVPTMALPITFAATSWPLYLSNYSRMSEALHWCLAALTVAFCVLAVLGIARLAEQRSPTMAAARE